MSNETRRATVGRIACGLIAAIALVAAGSASAKTYLVAGGGGQLAIGGGLPLPIQTVPPLTTGGGSAWAGNNFPPLLIPVAPGATVSGTTAMSTNQALVIPQGVLSKPPSPNTVGVFGQNPSLYAVRTDLGYTWPTAAVTLNTTKRTGANTTIFTGGLGLTPPSSVAYQAPPTGKFGGPARFRVTTGAPGGFIPGSPVTVFAIAVPGAGNPPCTHTALTPVPFPGPGNAACVAALLEANPNSIAAIGGPAGTIQSTLPGSPPLPGIGIGKFGPKGTVSFFTFTPAGTMAGLTNMATSAGFPLTVGKLVISAPAAAGAPEVFTITGNDARTAGGGGTIQLVAAAVSQRVLSGPNANRGWVQLGLVDPAKAVPTMGEWARIATIGLMAALTVGFLAVRRRGEAA